MSSFDDFFSASSSPQGYYAADSPYQPSPPLYSHYAPGLLPYRPQPRAAPLPTMKALDPLAANLTFPPRPPPHSQQRGAFAAMSSPNTYASNVRPPTSEPLWYKPARPSSIFEESRRPTLEQQLGILEVTRDRDQALQNMWADTYRRDHGRMKALQNRRAAELRHALALRYKAEVSKFRREEASERGKLARLDERENRILEQQIRQRLVHSRPFDPTAAARERLPDWADESPLFTEKDLGLFFQQEQQQNDHHGETERMMASIHSGDNVFCVEGSGGVEEDGVDNIMVEGFVMPDVTFHQETVSQGADIRLFQEGSGAIQDETLAILRKESQKRAWQFLERNLKKAAKKAEKAERKAANIAKHGGGAPARIVPPLRTDLAVLRPSILRPGHLIASSLSSVLQTFETRIGIGRDGKKYEREHRESYDGASGKVTHNIVYRIGEWGATGSEQGSSAQGPHCELLPGGIMSKRMTQTYEVTPEEVERMMAAGFGSNFEYGSGSFVLASHPSDSQPAPAWIVTYSKSVKNSKAFDEMWLENSPLLTIVNMSAQPGGAVSVDVVGDSPRGSDDSYDEVTAATLSD